MPQGRVFLTGATGLLGQYLLQDLLSQSIPVAVLARDSRKETAAERIAQIVNFWSDRLGRKLPEPTIVSGDLSQSNMGLTETDRHWIGAHCKKVIHSAASLSFKPNAQGEPWRTNLEGTRALIELCRAGGISQWHHISTAFVCGLRNGIITEDQLDQGQKFNNPYEESKFQSEKLLRASNHLQTTIYRPSVIVGDSRNGHTTTYTGVYRFCELAVRLASMNSLDGTELPLRVPMTGEEPWNLVPVDWVSQAIIELFGKPEWHGKTFHLVAKSSISTKKMHDIGLNVMGLRGTQFYGPHGLKDPTQLEQMFLEGIQEYWPYLGGNPIFTMENTTRALPHLPPPEMDQPLLERLVHFGIANRWGRKSRSPAKQNSGKPASSFFASYFEKTFPKLATQSRLPKEIGQDLKVSLNLQGSDGGQWSFHWKDGEFEKTTNRLEEKAGVTFQTDTKTIQAILTGAQTPQVAFFEEQITISGDSEMGLKVALLFAQLLSEQEFPKPQSRDLKSHSAVVQT